MNKPKSEPIKKVARKKDKSANAGLQCYFQYYAFPVLIAILIFYMFTQYIFDQVKQSTTILYCFSYSFKLKIKIETKKTAKMKESK